MIIDDLEKHKLPDTPGIYVFLDLEKLEDKDKKVLRAKKGEAFFRSELEKIKSSILYIGKATSLRDRPKSYFSNDLLHERGLHIANMVTLANFLVFIPTRSVLEALLLENDLIKEFQPPYNTASRDDKSYYVLVITEEKFPRVVLVRYKDIDKENNLILRSKFLGKIKSEKLKIRKTFGPYPSGQFALSSLKLIRKIFPFRDKCTPYDKKQPWKKNPCFSYQIGLCPGVCSGTCNEKQYSKIIERLLQFLEGNGEELRLELEKEMFRFSREEKFEEAQKNKDLIFALDHIRDAHLIQKDIDESPIRIEAYDIAHISGKNRVGVMTVFQNGVLAKHEYKKFKISTDKNDDLEGLSELFTRRMQHLDWGVPDVIVLDGDERHGKIVSEILENIKEDNGDISIKVILVTKDKSHKAAKITGDREIIEIYKQEIVLINSEAHRFAINYHKLLRKKSFFS